MTKNHKRAVINYSKKIENLMLVSILPEVHRFPNGSRPFGKHLLNMGFVYEL